MAKPPKRKTPNAAQIRAWLKKQGHAVDKADKCSTVADVLKLHGKQNA